MAKKKSILGSLLAVVFFILCLPIIIPVSIFFILLSLIESTFLILLVRINWIPRGKNTLFVYSQSPVWKDYIEKNIIPKISSQSIIMDWSERKSFNEWSLEYGVFKFWTGVRKHTIKSKAKWSGTDYNPIAIIFKPWWSPKVIRFWDAFKDYKHGHGQKLQELENELFNLLNIPQVQRELK